MSQGYQHTTSWRHKGASTRLADVTRLPAHDLLMSQCCQHTTCWRHNAAAHDLLTSQGCQHTTSSSHMAASTRLADVTIPGAFCWVHPLDKRIYSSFGRPELLLLMIIVIIIIIIIIIILIFLFIIIIIINKNMSAVQSWASVKTFHQSEDPSWPEETENENQIRPTRRSWPNVINYVNLTPHEQIGLT